jgi:hypothetical protein
VAATNVVAAVIDPAGFTLVGEDEFIAIDSDLVARIVQHLRIRGVVIVAETVFPNHGYLQVYKSA